MRSLQPTIRDLPPELLVRIASFLTTPELSSLRCSCKEIEAALFGNFAAEFFTKRQFMLERPSLEALVGIANHPGLAARVKQVNISNHAYAFALSGGRPSVLNDVPKHDEFVRTGEAHDKLTEAFSKLANLETVGLRDYNAAGRDREGRSARWRSWGWSLMSVRYVSPRSIFPLVLSALGASGAKPKAIETIIRHCDHLDSESFSLDNFQSKFQMTRPLDSLEKLILALDTRRHESTSHDDDPTSETALCRFLHYAADLKFLRLNFSNDDSSDGFLLWLAQPASSSAPPADMNILPVPPVPLSHLTTLEIGRTIVTGSTLMQLLSRFDLQSISLRRIRLRNRDQRRDSWAEIFTHLSRIISTNRLRSILIGYIEEVDLEMSPLVPAAVWFAPEGSDRDQDDKSLNQREVKFQAQYTATSAAQWLEELEKRTVVEKPPLEDEEDDDGNVGE